MCSDLSFLLTIFFESRGRKITSCPCFLSVMLIIILISMLIYEDSQSIPYQKADTNYTPHKSGNNITTKEKTGIRC